MIDEPIAHVMSKDPVCVTRQQKISEVWDILSGGRIHHLPVVEDGRVVGIVTPLDLAKLGICPFEDGDELTTRFLDHRLSVDQIMERKVVTLPLRSTVRDAASMLSAGGFHALPVVDEQRRLVGIVTSTDLIGYLLADRTARADQGAAVAVAAAPASGRSPPAGASIEQLRAVFKAAEIYLRSGLGEREHAALERAVEAARGASDVVI